MNFIMESLHDYWFWAFLLILAIYLNKHRINKLKEDNDQYMNDIETHWKNKNEDNEE